MASTAAVPLEELPVVNVSDQGGKVAVKWGNGGAQQTTAGFSDAYTTHFIASDSNGDEPVVKTFGSLLHCSGGILRIRLTRYRIQAQPQERNDFVTPAPSKKKSKSTSPGAILEKFIHEGCHDSIADVIGEAFFNHLSTMKVPASPFRLPELGEFTKIDIGHTLDLIDMRFNSESSPVGVILRDQLKSVSPQHVILLGKSGVGKTTAIFDAASEHWCVLFTASSQEEDLFSKRDPGGFDRSFAVMVNNLSEILAKTSISDDKKKSGCDRLVKSFVIARVMVMLHFSSLQNASPLLWLVYQLTDDLHTQTLYVYNALKTRKSDTLQQLSAASLSKMENMFFAFDEAQYGYELLRKKQEIWKGKTNDNERRQGVACPFIRTLGTFGKPVVLAGTAMSLGSAASCKSDLGKGDPGMVITDFPSISYAEIEQRLVEVLDLKDVELPQIAGLWKLEGRGRLLGGLVRVLADTVKENPQNSKQDNLSETVKIHYNAMLRGLIIHIKAAFTLPKDKLLANPGLPEGFQKLAIAALWGGTISLSSSNFDIDLLHIGLCSVQKLDDENLYILDEELGRQAILDVAQEMGVVASRFQSVLHLCRQAGGHAIEPLLIAELRA
eukprot:scaffold96531_cov91-Attheya_sp.AAC.1